MTTASSSPTQQLTGTTCPRAWPQLPPQIFPVRLFRRLEAPLFSPITSFQSACSDAQNPRFSPPSNLSSPLGQTPRTPSFLPKAHDIISRIIEFGRRIERNRIGSPQDDEEDASIGGRLLSSQPCGALISFEKTEKNTSAIIIIIVVVVIIITVLMC